MSQPPMDMLLYNMCKIEAAENLLSAARREARHLQRQIDELEPPPPPTPPLPPPETIEQRTRRLYKSTRNRTVVKPRGASLRIWRLLLSEA